jgi:hypothetical protein
LGRDWDLVGDEGVPSGVLDKIAVEIIDDGEIGAVDFLCGYPEDVFRVGFGLGYGLFEFSIGGGLD